MKLQYFETGYYAHNEQELCEIGNIWRMKFNDPKMIFTAAKHGHKPIIQHFIEVGGDINDALFVACYGGHIDIAQDMISRGANF